MCKSNQLPQKMGLTKAMLAKKHAPSWGLKSKVAQLRQRHVDLGSKASG